MENLQFPIGTTEALAIAGLDRKVWNNAIQRQLYPGAPPVGPAGHPRLFTCDDMICLYVFTHFSEDFGASMAGRIATAVKAELKKGGDAIDKLWVVRTKSGVPHRVVSTEPPQSLLRHEIDVGLARRTIAREMARRSGK